VPERQTCKDCQKQSPETETDYTLISAQYGWRLTRSKGRDGSLLLEWRCPSCWAKHKAGAAADTPTASHVRPRSPSDESLRGERPDSAEATKKSG
jgi:hypothetical protein